MDAIRGFVSVVAPVRNAERFLESYVEECVGLLGGAARDHEIIVVDGLSVDRTPEVAVRLLKRFPTLRYVRLARPYSTDILLTAGLDTAIGDYVVLTSPECDPPSEIPAMLRKAASTECGIVTGIDPSGGGQSLKRRLFHGLFALGCRRILGIEFPAHATRFQVLTRAAATAIARTHDKRPQFPVFASQAGFGGTTYSYRRVARPGADVPKKRLDAIDRAVSIVVLNSLSPLRFASLFAVAGGTLNLLYAGYVVAVYAFKDAVAPGWTTLSLQTSVMFLFVFLVLVVMCEYLGHTLEEATDRPLYHVLDEKSASPALKLADARNILDRSA